MLILLPPSGQSLPAAPPVLGCWPIRHRGEYGLFDLALDLLALRHLGRKLAKACGVLPSAPFVAVFVLVLALREAFTGAWPWPQPLNAAGRAGAAERTPCPLAKSPSGRSGNATRHSTIQSSETFTPISTLRAVRQRATHSRATGMPMNISTKPIGALSPSRQSMHITGQPASSKGAFEWRSRTPLAWRPTASHRKGCA